VLIPGLLAALGVWPRRQADPLRDAALPHATAFIAVTLILLATLPVSTITPVGLAVGERPISYTHLASASFASHRYQLAAESALSDGSLVILYRCDSSGVWRSDVDRLGGAGQSSGGYVRYHTTTRTLTASEGGHLLLTYPAGDLFGGP
jgi:hypothetical protein